MTEKRYYEEWEKYNDISKRKAFNDLFYDKEGFECVKKSLLRELKSMYIELENEVFYKQKKAREAGYRYQAEKLLAHASKISALIGKIENEECVEKEEYLDTYFEMKFFGILNAWQMIVLVFFVVIALALYKYLS